MKKLFVLFVIILFTNSVDTDARIFRGGVTLGYFYSTLSPYGEWIEIDYDVFVWRPTTVHFNWRPYSIGSWHWTRHGWYWNSYEPFGWATYHYGRWFYDDYLGWVWMPDNEWGPSWVEWRYDDVHIGWAPLPPYAIYRAGVGIHFSITWHSNYNHWNFVRYNRFCHNNVHNYFSNTRENYRIFNRTKYRTNYYSNRGRIINGGIDKKLVEKRAGYRIAEREIVSVNKLNDYSVSRSLENNKIRVYRPSDEEVKKYRNENVEVKKSSSKTSIRTDKIQIKRAVGDEKKNLSNGSVDRKSGNTFDKKRNNKARVDKSKTVKRTESKSNSNGTQKKVKNVRKNKYEKNGKKESNSQSKVRSSKRISRNKSKESSSNKRYVSKSGSTINKKEATKVTRSKPRTDSKKNSKKSVVKKSEKKSGTKVEKNNRRSAGRN